jgi:hypothetical protein
MKYKMAANQALKRFSRQIIKEDASRRPLYQLDGWQGKGTTTSKKAHYSDE